MKIKNVENLRNYLLDCIEKAARKEMDIDELSIVSKSAEVIFSSIKTQLIYNNMRQEQPDIDFLQTCNNGKKIGINSHNPEIKNLIHYRNK